MSTEDGSENKTVLKTLLPEVKFLDNYMKLQNEVAKARFLPRYFWLLVISLEEVLK